MLHIIRKYYLSNRTAVSDDTDKLAEDIRRILDCRISEIPSGSECLTWKIPKHWKAREGLLESLDGKRIVDFHSHPLHLWTHSVSYKGVISREELEKHLFYDKNSPDWVPYHHRNGYRYDVQEWGFCLSYKVFKQLKDKEYRVYIDTDLDNNGTLKIVDCYLKGEYPETIFFSSHICHPGSAVNGLAGAAVAIELFKKLQAMKKRRYSYRLILGPQYFAAAGFLANTPLSEIELLKGGITLNFLGNNQPLGYQSSFQGNSRIDKICKNLFDNHVPEAFRRAYRKLIGNDEMFYNGPGFLIPTIGIGGLHHPECNFDADNFDVVNPDQLVKSTELLLKIIEALESDFIPVPKFRGPLYLSRYGLYVDRTLNQKGYDNIEAIQILMDGENSCLDISHELGIDFCFVRDFCEQVCEKGLLEKEYKNFLN